MKEAALWVGSATIHKTKIHTKTIFSHLALNLKLIPLDNKSSRTFQLNNV